jgi:hypothetical protein
MVLPQPNGEGTKMNLTAQEQATYPITLNVHHCNHRFSFLAHFAREKDAVSYLVRKNDEQAYNIQEELDRPVPREFKTLIKLLYPECEHGLDLNLCYGPQHYPYDEDEMAAYGL